MATNTTQSPGQTELYAAKVIVSLAKKVMDARLQLARANGVVQDGARIAFSNLPRSRIDVITSSIEQARRIAGEAIHPLREAMYDAANADPPAFFDEHYPLGERVGAANGSLRAIGGHFIPTNNPVRFYSVTEELDGVLEPLQNELIRASFELELRAHELANAAELADGPAITDGGTGQFIGQ